MPANKLVPRFVPTLTEVVQPGQPSPAPTPTIDLEQLVQQAMQLAKPRLEQELRASLQALVEQHMRSAAPRLQRDIEEAVRVAVAQAVTGSSLPQN